MSSESRRIHRGMIEPAFPPTQSVVPPIPRRGMTRRAFCAGAAFLAAAGTLSLAGCNSLPFTGAAPVRLVIKVPRTGHDVVFDDSISQVETVIQGMAEGFQRDYERPVDVEVVVFEQNQYDEAVKGSFDTDKAPDFTAITSISPPTFAPGASCRWTTLSPRLSATTSSTTCGTWAWWRAAHI